jgi:hypothetical protein
LLTGIDKYLDIVYKDRYKPVINLLTTYMSKPIGGRGKKAPYETTHVRIPVDLKSKVEELVEAYRNNELIVSGKNEDKSARNLPIDYHELVVKMIEEFKNNNLFIHENPDRKYPLTLILSREEAIEYGRTLVIQARTKKNVAENLLTALYQVDIKL